MTNPELNLENKSIVPDEPPKGQILNAGKEKYRRYFFQSAMIWGGLAGMAMVMYLLLLSVFGVEYNIPLFYGMYVILFLVLGYQLACHKEHLRKGIFFQHGIMFGMSLAFFAAISYSVLQFIFFLIKPAMIAQRFNQTMDSQNPFNLLALSISGFLEMLVFGLIWTFIWLQYLKRRPDEKFSTPRQST